MSVFEEEDFLRMKDPESMKKSKKEALAKRKRLEEKRLREIEDLDELFEEVE